jgi:hypothetical protein
MMTGPLQRSLLVLLFVAAAAAAGLVGLQLAGSAEDDERHAAALEAATRSLLVSIGEARATLHGMAAAGMASASLERPAVEAIAGLRAEIDALRGFGLEPSALNDVDAAMAAAVDLAGIAEEAADMLRIGQPGEAGEIAFSEDADLAFSSLLQRVDALWESERTAWAARDAARNTRFASVLTGTAGVAFLVIGLLALNGRSQPAAEPAQAADVPAPAAAAETAVETGAAQGAAGAPASGTTGEPPRPHDRDPAAAPDAASNGPVRDDRRRAPELIAAADLCTDFARLGDVSEIPALLGRAARLIDASGLIVWVVDPVANALEPLLAHGYPPHAVARVPAIPREADNATAAAWRDGDVQMVRTNGMTPGALAVPLLTDRGCVGVLATEVRHGREASPAVRALTRLIAAQVAPLVSPPAARVEGDPGETRREAHA